VGLLDAVLERLLGGPLEAHVEREAHRLAGLRRREQRAAAARPAERVDAHARRPGDAAQVRVVLPLDAGLPDLVAGLVALRGELPELGL
jgi:hypothetical protein